MSSLLSNTATGGQPGDGRNDLCLLCSVGLGSTHGRECVLMDTAQCTMSDRRVGDVLTDILGSLDLLFASLCNQCFQLLDFIDTLELKLKLKKGEVHNLYFNSRNHFNDGSNEDENKNSKSSLSSESSTLPDCSSGDAQDVQTFPVVIPSSHLELVEPPKKKDKGLLTSTDLKCQICSKTFEKRRYLMDHLRRVHNSAIHQCCGCRMRFKYREELVTHQAECEAYIQIRQQERGEQERRRMNTKFVTKRKKNNQCNICDSYFLTQALLAKHKRMHHQEKHHEEEAEEGDETKIESPVSCPLCHIMINNEYALAIHQGSVHGLERPWICKICGKTFARHLELENHRRVHSGERPFQCDVCGARFNQKQNLHTHVRHLHLGERRYSCNDCGAKFRRRRLLDCHINSKHKGEKPYSCSLCSATFVYPEHVKKHEMTHSVERHQCGECRKTFKSKASLDNHMAVHRPASNYQCLTCPLCFWSRGELLDHLRETGHSKGVYSSSRGPEDIGEGNTETFTLSFMEEREEGGTGEKLPTQGEHKEQGEEEEGGKPGPGEYEDVVFYLTEGLCYTDSGQPVYIAQQGATAHIQEEHTQETEVQSAILSIVDTECDSSQ